MNNLHSEGGLYNLNRCMIVETDLDRDLKFSTEIVELCGDVIKVKDKYQRELYRKQGIKNLLIECNLSICKLIVISENDIEEIAYFTRMKEEDFRKLLQTHHSQQFIQTPTFQSLKTLRRSRMNETLKWLFNIILHYKKPLLIGIIVSIILSFINIMPPYIMKLIIDNVLANSSPSTSLFITLILLLLAVYTVTTFLSILRGRVLGILGHRVSADISIELYRHVMLAIEPLKLDNIGIGKLTSRIVDDTASLNWLLTWLAPSLVGELLNIIFIGGAMAFVGSYLCLYTLLPIPLVVIFVIYYRKIIWPLFNARWRRSSEIYTKIYDTVPNYLVVRAFDKPHIESNAFSVLRYRLYDTETSIVKLNSLFWPILSFSLNIVTLIIFWKGGLGVIEGSTKLGTITALVTYASQLYMSITRIGDMYQQFQRTLISAERIRDLLAIRQSLDEKTLEKETYECRCTDTSRVSNIVFDNVYFSYGEDNIVLRDLSFIISRGEKVAIIGKSGAGKSTIVKLLLGLYKPLRGRIIVNNIEIDNMNNAECLRKLIGYVPQEITLFNTTVGFNVAYGLNKYDPVEIVKACKISMIHDEIVRLPLAYDTFIGERGFKLSVGQRQRIAIARAVIKNPDIYLFDEATANLDVVNEKAVFTAILAIAKDKTAIFVTHNVFEILLADKVIVIDRGTKVEEGEPLKLLLDKSSRLYNMFKEQIIGRNIIEIADIINTIKHEVRNINIEYNIANEKELKILDYDEKRNTIKIIYRGRVIDGLKPKRLFPITAPNIVGLYTADNDEILILDTSHLDETSRNIIEKASDRHGKIFTITKVYKIITEGESVIWFVDTDCGKTRIEIIYRGGMSQIYELGDMLIIIDKHNNIFKIDYRLLDSRSLKLISKAL